MEMHTNKQLLRSQAFIDGKWVDAQSGKTFDVINPATQEIITHVPDMGESDTLLAIEAANQAFQKWRYVASKEREEILLRWFDLMMENQADLAKLMTLEQGKPLKEAAAEVEYAAAFVQWFAEEAKRTYGDVIPNTSDGKRIIVIKQPIGVAAAITPWNFPLAMITRKCAPALAAGCSVVLKPAKETPLSALALAVLAEAAGFPAGLLNIVTSIDAETVGKALTLSKIIRKVSFTGSTAVGKLLMMQSASTVKKISLELGGNAPFIVFNDADIDQAVQGAIAAKFRNSGQTCICPNRILVQDAIYDEFARKLTQEVKKLKVGNGLEPGIDQGPLINHKAVEKVQAHLKDALAKGAKILTGGNVIEGNFFEPTVLIDANSEMLLAHEETFGPIAALFRFHTLEQGINMANDTQFGLASYFYSENIHRVFYIAEALECGMVGVNTGRISAEFVPFGGVKESGIGREGSKYGIDEYLEIKTVSFGQFADKITQF
jgi:succinate-semialdehyde dehydrogenase/glutarate-semialdehyde dehydrogenase